MNKDKNTPENNNGIKRSFNDCSLCGKKDQHGNDMVIRGEHLFACDPCMKNGTEVILEGLMVRNAYEMGILRDENFVNIGLDGEFEDDLDTTAEPEAIENIPSPKAIKEHLDDYVIGQQAAKKTLSVAVHNHYKRIDHAQNTDHDGLEIEKSNIMILGPTGSGKTHLAKTIAKTLGVPFAQADANSMTPAGYIGDDVTKALEGLLESANYNVEQAQKGIIYIDEIDKIARRETTGQRDVGGEGAQQALLKMMEGDIIEIEKPGGHPMQPKETIKINTANILFIFSGAFAGLQEHIEAQMKTAEKNNKSGLGFNSEAKETAPEMKRQSAKIGPSDLESFGMIPEFVGRMPVITSTQKLDKSDLIEILTRPKNALVKQYQALFAKENAKLTITDEALEAISQKALARKTGARGLRSIMEDTLEDAMYELPDTKHVTEVVIDADVVNDNKPAKFLYGVTPPKQRVKIAQPG